MGQIKNLMQTENLDETTEVIKNIEMELKEKEHKEHIEKRESMQLKRRQSKIFIDKVVEDVLEGWTNPLEAFIVFNDVKKKIDKGIKEIYELAEDESLAHGKTYNYQGYKITNVEGRRSFDYSGCAEIVELEKHLKERKEFYKKAKISSDAGGWSEVQTLPDGTTREVFQDSNNELLVAPTIKYSKSFIKIENKL